MSESCIHSPGRIRYAVARDDTVSTGQVLWGMCCDCGEVVLSKPLKRVKPAPGWNSETQKVEEVR